MHLQRFLDVLRCPQSKTRLQIAGNDELVSEAGHRYPIVRGKPILVRHIEPMHVTPPADSIVSQNSASYTPPETDGWVLHLGSGNVPSSAANVISMDILPLDNVDIVAEGEALPFADNSLGLVESGAVFEHLYDPLKSAAEVRRVLRPGGFMRIDTAFMQGYHGFPSHYFNMTPQAIETFLVDDFILDLGLVPISGTPPYSMENSLKRYLAAMPEDEQARLKSLSVEQFIDEMSGAMRERRLHPYIERALAASYFVMARKPEGYESRPTNDAHRRLKRSYYAARVAVIEHHFETSFYRDQAIAKGWTPEPVKQLDIFLNAGKVIDTMNPEAWKIGLQVLQDADREIIHMRLLVSRSRVGAYLWLAAGFMKDNFPRSPATNREGSRARRRQNAAFAGLLSAQRRIAVGWPAKC